MKRALTALAIAAVWNANAQVIDKNGVIRFKQIGPITPKVWQDKMLPLIRQLEQA